MPEGLEAEIYRRSAVACVGRTIEAVQVDDMQPEAIEIRASLPGSTVTSVGRHGKLVLVELHTEGIVPGTIPSVVHRNGGDLTLGLHFGMTGRLIIDGAAAIDRLEYGSNRDDPAWNRLIITFVGGQVLRVNDPRRWARFTMEPDDERLGPDVLSLTRADLAVGTAKRQRALKAVLLDQTVIAGFGNLCVDEVLWHASLDPRRPAGGLSSRELGRLWRTTIAELPAMLGRGGSHTGTINPALRASGGPCPRRSCCGHLQRGEVGGRTTIWCPSHQR
ncbi:MAG TPA: DNA-formamidopyrimidine glycosylase family protein [Ilumatobacter sp.]|nr:DNA-formamidopyrimidine glycosylase family protein [Ilumatobacter sp.]